MRMPASLNELVTRRNIMIGGGGAVVVAGVAFGGWELLRKRYAPTPYDDLLSRLDDRDADAQIGEEVLADDADFDTEAVAAEVRKRLQGRTLAEAAAADVAAGRVVEAHGWVLPETLGLLCALAAKSAS